MTDTGGTGVAPELKAGLLEVMIEQLGPTLSLTQLQEIYGLVNAHIPWGDERCKLRNLCVQLATDRGWVLEELDEQDPSCD